MLVHATVALCSLLSILPSTLSVPLFIPRDDANTTTTPVSNATVNADLNTPALFSRVIYCSVPAIQNLTCGSQCDALGGNVDVLQIGGDGGLVPMYLVASDPDNDQVVVAHQGTDLGMFMSLLNDAKFALKDLNTTRFTSADGLGIQVHDGFQETFERTADGVLSGVQSALASTGMKKVLVTGHSLGAAIATLDAMMLKQNLDPSVNIQATVFGLPRVGNQAWADFVDNGLSKSLKFVTNQNDIVPRVPPQFLDFVHPSGEIHINDVNDQGQATNIVACDGQDNESCSTGDSVLEVSIPNHLGPYFNDISFGGKACPT